ncbi:uncharacterized protein LOC125757903 [Rhipicephalus sanguineus]|uniref:uncharacterized protein LOC125757903 n=1 Tax=Rhipicephalus sanguineus TaxID=34632 RepID=UPI0020C1C6AF|nr:uncharacterized protein LOC125757903 [Rhipicephalus sanguineus]
MQQQLAFDASEGVQLSSINTEAGHKFLSSVPVFEDLPADIVLGADYLLSGDVRLTVEGSSVNLRPVARSTPPAQPAWSVDEKFRHYLFGRHFTVVTDNSAIAWMFQKRHLKHKFARWIVRLQDYTYDIRHRAGAQNQLADALSRNPIEESSPRNPESWIMFSQQDVTKAQRGDEGLVSVIDSIEDTGPYVMANGLTERSNQTIQARLAPYWKNHKRGEADWDDHLQAAAYAVNTAAHSSAGTCPYEIVYGQLPQLNATFGLDTPVKVKCSVARQTLCREIRMEARRRIAHAQQAQKRYYVRRHRPAPKYSIGDEVWLQRGAPSSSDKLRPKYEGPFIISERLGENTWRSSTIHGF